MENIKPIRVKRIIENFDFSSNAIVKIIMSDDGDEPIYTDDIMGVPWWIVRDCWVDTCAEYEGISLYIENEKPVLEITCRETKEG